MQTTFRFHTDDLDEQMLRRVLDALRTLYPHQEVDLSIATKVDDEMDETEYLLSTEANRKHLEMAMANTVAGNVIHVSNDELDQMRREAERRI